MGTDYLIRWSLLVLTGGVNYDVVRILAWVTCLRLPLPINLDSHSHGSSHGGIDQAAEMSHRARLAFARLLDGKRKNPKDVDGCLPDFWRRELVKMVE